MTSTRRIRKTRKKPVTASKSSSTPNHKVTQSVISKFHVLKKRESALASERGDDSVEALRKVREEMEALGGLEVYQNMSVLGQSRERGGGSEKVLVDWLESTLPDHKGKGKGKEIVDLLDVGALKPDNYDRFNSWIRCTPMDLRSRHPRIIEQDFLQLDVNSNVAKWDVISLSLVINFVPDPYDRGRMLRLARKFIRPSGLVFLVLPLPCLTNSRYFDFNFLRDILTATGFIVERERWNENGGKVAYFLCRAVDQPASPSLDLHKKRAVREGGGYNNFTILLPVD